tara:strand:+ start:1552 stop:3402 length:1851 start_codon:yes stop_codon:yes gene_type:complete
MAQRLNIDIVARDKASRTINSLKGGLSKIKGAVFNLQNAFLGLGAGLAVRNLVNTGKELENLQVRLRFLLKDANEGAKAFDNMTKFASKVPFSLEQIQGGAGILATVTDNARDLQNMLEITGNVAAVTGLDFRTTAEQIQRSMSAGIGAADLFREKGVRNMLGFQAGAVVSIEQTAEAFERVFGKGGRFGKATDELANTLEGRLSMIGDKVFNFKKTLLDAGFFAELKRQFGDLDKTLDRNADSIDRIAIGFGTVLANAVQGISNLFKTLADNIDKVIVAFKILIAIKIVTLMVSLGKAVMVVLAGLRGIVALSGVGLALVGASVVAVTATFVAMNHEIDKISEGLSEAIDKNIEFKELLSGADANEGFVAPLKETLEKLKDINVECRQVPSKVEAMMKSFEELNNTALENLRNKISDIRTTIVEGLDAGIKSFSNSLSRAIILGEDLGKSFKKMVADALVNTLSVLIEIIIRMGIQKLLGIELGKVEKKQLNTMKQKTAELQKQVALQAILVAMGGGGGGGKSSSGLFGFFASGGSVPKNQPVVVGENGAELFIPNQAGQITQSARGTGTGSVNVNFTINAVDASGVDKLLIERRGTISRIINESVNERGRNSII